MFDGVFEFTICGSSTIDDDTYYPVLHADSDFSSFYGTAELLGTPNSEHCVKVFAVPSTEYGSVNFSGLGYNPIQFPTTPGIVVASVNAEKFAHELGHYFYLPHTFQGGPADQFVSTNPVVCLNSGDGFCDTPADPGEPFCTFTSGCTSVSCTVTDPLSVPYQPDQALIMSYYLECPPFYFSDEQKVIMSQVVDINQTAYGNLVNDVPFDCLVPAHGSVERNCSDVPGAPGCISFGDVLLPAASRCLSCRRKNIEVTIPL